MDDERVITANFRLAMDQECAMGLFTEGVLGEIDMSSVSGIVYVRVEIEGRARAIYISRPTERVYAYTGPCAEPDCDGHHLIGHLPMETDHVPDGWEPMMFDVRVNGKSVERKDLDRVLEVCVPEERVRACRDLVGKIDARTGFAR